MQIEVHGQNIEVTDALRSYVEEKMTRLGRHGTRGELRVQLRVDKPDHRAEGNLKLPGGDYHADASAQTMYAAIDLLVDKLDRLLIKHKEKLTDHRRGDNPTRDGTFG
ncbi:ribosome-associated translation inhibitor RaiA [Lysobacter pythonis]|uniref:Ribosome hibernation promoting factor n=1 Tax=Solilutibacter pythonis TaxID=2483112 RepID=A0A3M2HWL5_9GAMM|nr:ribosome-associated translation inhibitor RaiA [Lysobacter pythonis]RMH94116.1 ribosome-associated translation inhibitor RaiA [Lysobacter pythonis]